MAKRVCLLPTKAKRKKYKAVEDPEESTTLDPYCRMSEYRDFEILDGNFPYMRKRLSEKENTRLMLPDYFDALRVTRVLRPLRGKQGDGRTIDVISDDKTQEHLFTCSNQCGGRMVLKGDRLLRFTGHKRHMEVTECEPCTCPKLMNHANKRCGHIQEPTAEEARRCLLRCFVHEYGIAVHDYTDLPPPGFTFKSMKGTPLLFENPHPDAPAIEQTTEHFFGKLADGAWFHVALAELGGGQKSWMPMSINEPRKVSTKLYSGPTMLTGKTTTSGTPSVEAVTDPTMLTGSVEAVTDGEDKKLPACEVPGTHVCQICFMNAVTCRLVCGRRTSSGGCPGAKLCQSCSMRLLSSRRPEQLLRELDTTWWLDNRKTRYAACPLNCGQPVRFMKSPPEADESTNITHMIPCFFAVERPYYGIDELQRDWWAFDYYVGPIAASRKSIAVEMEHLRQVLETSGHSGNHPISATRAYQQKKLKLDIEKQQHFLDQTRYPRWAKDWKRDFKVPPEPDEMARLPLPSDVTLVEMQRWMDCAERHAFRLRNFDWCGTNPTGDAPKTITPQPWSRSYWHSPGLLSLQQFLIKTEVQRSRKFERSVCELPTSELDYSTDSSTNGDEAQVISRRDEADEPEVIDISSDSD